MLPNFGREGELILHTMAATCNNKEDDLSARNLHRRYSGLVTARTRAIRGKGAWYWSHLEPILVHSHQTGTPKALKLRCSFCSTLFSASNPSRTATEHLKRGTCPKFQNPEANGNGSMSLVRRHCQLAVPSLPMFPASSHRIEQPLCNTPTKPQLTNTQIDIALNMFAEWFYESCGYVSLSTVNHPKFKAFLRQVGLPTVDERYISGRRLDTKYAEAKSRFENKLHDALFFQLSTNGWKKGKQRNNTTESNTSVDIILNLPNRSSLFHRILLLKASNLSSNAIQEMLLSMVQEVSGYDIFRCAGVIADINDVNSKALQELERKHHWMINLTCQSYALCKLLKDFFKRLPMFVKTASLCQKIVEIIKTDHLGDMNMNFNSQQSLHLGRTSADILAIEIVALFASKLGQFYNNRNSSTPPVKQEDEIYTAIHNPKFCEELHSVAYLTKSIKTLIQATDEEKPYLGQCLLLWTEVKSRIKTWCTSFSIEERPVMELVNKRFSMNYHQAWAASYILDPMYLVEDSCGRYLPPFKLLTSEQEKDVIRIITRLTQDDEAHIALMELMKWRTEGLDPVYARAVQAKERDPVTGKMKVMNPCGSRLLWETHLGEFKVLKKVAARLVFLRATTGRLKWKHSILSRMCPNSWTSDLVERAHKLLFVSLHGRLERGESTDEDEKDSELFGNESNEVVNETVVHTPNS